MTLPLRSVLELLAGPQARHHNDASSAASLNVREHALPLPKGVTLQWLGTAGFAIGYAGHVLLIDPYLTRPRAGAVFGMRALQPDLALIERLLPRVDAVLLGHTHFDHALDVPAIARLRGATVYGSRSAAHLMGLHGLHEQAVEVELRRRYAIGPFEVTFIESRHSKLALGLAVPMGGELTCDHLDDLHGGSYRCGQVYGIHIAVAGVSFYHQGSANLIDERIEHRGVDYFLAGIAGRGFTPDYTARILRALQPRYVIPQHYDDFFRPLQAPMGFSFNVNFGGFLEEVRRVSADFSLHTLQPLQVVGRE